MIRRGLQFLCCLVLLGAAPCFAQEDPYSIFPQSLVLQDRATTSVGDPNGYYVQVTQQLNYTGSVFQRFGQDPLTAFRIGLLYSRPNASFPNGFWEIRLEQNGSIISQTIIVGATIPSPFSMSGGGTVILNQLPPDPNAPYEEAFPDWESAAVKIPLGFTLAMAFWAAAVGLSVSMKWVRDLASAAT